MRAWGIADVVSTTFPRAGAPSTMFGGDFGVRLVQCLEAVTGFSGIERLRLARAATDPTARCLEGIGECPQDRKTETRSSLLGPEVHQVVPVSGMRRSVTGW